MKSFAMISGFAHAALRCAKTQIVDPALCMLNANLRINGINSANAELNAAKNFFDLKIERGRE
jgi:hypothetical protein